jgi:D-psicose/D-tagatose/L-ribulose 3-epimerase
MQFGANTYIWALEFGPEHFDVLPRLKAAGFDGVELPIVDPARFPTASIRRALDGSGLACTTCTFFPKDASLTSDDPAARARGRNHVASCVTVAAELGAPVIGGPLYTPVGTFTGVRRTAAEWDRLVESWRELAPAIEAAGVTVAIEPLNRFETYTLNTVADGVRLCEAVASPAIGLLVDTFHANIEEKRLDDALRRAGRHLVHVHTCENDRGTPGTGHVDWPALFATLGELGYDRWLTIESFGFSLGAISAAASIWRDLAPTPESIAVDGVAFLRRSLANARRPALNRPHPDRLP